MSTIVASIEAEQVAEQLFRTPEGRMDPYPLYHRLRELAPVHYSDAARAWMLSRYEDGYSALRDPRLGKDFVERMDGTRPWWRERPSLARFEKTMLNIDGPEHTRLRRMVSKVFTFRSIEKLRPSVERMVDELLDPMAEAGGGDLVTELAFPLPVKVIGELLGVPEGDREQFRGLVRDITATFEPQIHREQFDAADEAIGVVDTYFYDLVSAKRSKPGDDLLSRLVHVEESDDRLTDEELVTLATLLFVAGFETTTNLIGNAMVGFFRHPEQIDALRARPDLYGGLPPEVLRYDGTVQLVLRQAKDDYPVDGVTIPPGQSVLIMVAAGNHDPARYDAPDRLDVTRTDVKPLSFGGGIHFCLGAALASVEIEIVFRKLFERFGTVEPDGDIPAHKDRLTLRGMESLPITLATARSATTVTPTPSAPTAPSAPAQRAAAPASFDGLGPRPSGDDTEWRAAFRRHVEDAPASDADLQPRIELLRSIPLFVGCTSEELTELARTAYPLSFDPGDLLCVEGADPGECYVIAEGEATVTIGDRVVATVGADDIVGEKGPIEGRPRAATVTATTHMITYAISRTHLQRLLDQSPTAAGAMRDLVARRYGSP